MSGGYGGNMAYAHETVKEHIKLKLIKCLVNVLSLWVFLGGSCCCGVLFLFWFLGFFVFWGFFCLFVFNFKRFFSIHGWFACRGRLVVAMWVLGTNPLTLWRQLSSPTVEGITVLLPHYEEAVGGVWLLGTSSKHTHIY